MLRFPPAKINIGLNVLARRADGYHDLESVMVPIPLHDVVEAVIDPGLPRGEIIMSHSGLPVPGDPAGDLCLRAAHLVGERHELPGLRLHLHKCIPMGAGLGGGSSDAAHVLLLLCDLLDLPLDQAELHAMAATLGSDVPFFLHHGAQLAEGRGERLQPLYLDLNGVWLVLVNPGIHMGTAEVYAGTKPTGKHMPLGATLTGQPMEGWDDQVYNVMEAHVFRIHPEIGRIKELLLSAGAAYASMSGSGSSVFGLFRQRPPTLKWPQHYRSWSLPMATAVGATP